MQKCLVCIGPYGVNTRDKILMNINHVLIKFFSKTLRTHRKQNQLPAFLMTRKVRTKIEMHRKGYDSGT